MSGRSPKSSSKDGAKTREAAPEAEQDEELRELTRALLVRLEQCQQQHQHCDRQEPPIWMDTMAELLVLLTGFRSLWELPEVPSPSRIDEHIEDMIDPEFGLRPARRIMTQAAERMLYGYDALRLPRRRRRPGVLTDLDED